MKIIKDESYYKCYKDLNELELAYAMIVEKAIKAIDLSYAPYSKFKVGAALLLENGVVVMGANQENASYPLCMCAERVALYNSSILYPNQKILAIAITAVADNNKHLDPIPPCGACRQVIAEYELRQKMLMNILLKGSSPEIWEYEGIAGLLPKSFDNTYLP